MDDTTVSKTSVYEQDDLQPTSEQEEQLDHMDKHIGNLQKEHPAWDLKASSRWWAPSIAFGADLQVWLEVTRLTLMFADRSCLRKRLTKTLMIR